VDSVLRCAGEHMVRLRAARGPEHDHGRRVYQHPGQDHHPRSKVGLLSTDPRPLTQEHPPAVSGKNRLSAQHRACVTVRAGRRRRACLRTRRSAATALSARRACCGPPTYTMRSSSATAASCWRASPGGPLTHERAALLRTPCACMRTFCCLCKACGTFAASKFSHCNCSALPALLSGLESARFLAQHLRQRCLGGLPKQGAAAMQEAGGEQIGLLRSGEARRRPVSVWRAASVARAGLSGGAARVRRRAPWWRSTRCWRRAPCCRPAGSSRAASCGPATPRGTCAT